MRCLSRPLRSRPRGRIGPTPPPRSAVARPAPLLATAGPTATLTLTLTLTQMLTQTLMRFQEQAMCRAVQGW
jgi:hypothetical protein